MDKVANCIHVENLCTAEDKVDCSSMVVDWGLDCKIEKDCHNCRVAEGNLDNSSVSENSNE
jgi:hypothetical protein